MQSKECVQFLSAQVEHSKKREEYLGGEVEHLKEDEKKSRSNREKKAY